MKNIMGEAEKGFGGKANRILKLLVERNNANGIGSVILFFMIIVWGILLWHMEFTASCIVLFFFFDGFFYVGSERAERDKIATCIPGGGFVTFYRSFFLRR